MSPPNSARVITMSAFNSNIRRIKFSSSATRAGRIQYLTSDDVRILLSRLTDDLWERLRGVYFNDRAWGRRISGYVSRGHRDISICALPASVSCALVDCRKYACSPATFGAVRGRQWPRLAVRRFLLYEVFLHELGHLQIADPAAKTLHRRFASETLAEKFAKAWRKNLWAQPFDHPDPVHNPPISEELDDARNEDRMV